MRTSAILLFICISGLLNSCKKEVNKKISVSDKGIKQQIDYATGFEIVDYGSYKTEIYDYCNLQIGFTDEATEVFDLPKNHIDYGKNVAAYYYWVFPNMMFNFYPWGLSVNIVKPLDLNRTKVSFISYVLDPTKLDRGASGDIDKVQREDEFVVEHVQKGVRSSFYKAGRFSPTREKGVHHFHRLLAEFLNK